MPVRFSKGILHPCPLKFRAPFFLAQFFILMAFISLAPGRLAAQSCTGSASFSVSGTRCAGSAVTFTNNSSSTTNASSYYWRFGDGDLSDTFTSITTDTHTYATPGHYTVWLVRQGSSCKDSVSMTVWVGSTTKPTASFSFTPDSACMGDTVTFTDGSTGSMLSYLWEFDDGTTSTLKDPTHVFRAYGTGTESFSVKLTVTDSGGCQSDDTTIIVTVKEAPQPLLDDDLNPMSPFIQCSSSSTTSSFTITAKNYTTGASSYTIDWGDGSSVFSGGSTFDTVSHTYTSVGTFNLVFTATGSNGCSKDTTIEVVNESNPSVGLTTLGNTNGCLPVTFKYILSASNVSSTTEFIWDFGDGSSTVTWDYTKANDTISHTFTTTSCGQTNNEFIVRVRGVNGCGETVATVSGTKIADKPVADFDLSANSGCAGVTSFSVTDESTLNCLGGTHRYAWNWGDGTGWTSLSPFATTASHTYNLSGNFTICHVVQNTCGPDTICRPVTVDTIPQAGFTSSVSPSSGCVPLVANFTNTTSGGTNHTYLWTVSPSSGWSFTNSTGSSSANPQITFTSAGTYIVTLRASNTCGFTTFSDTIVATAPPTVGLSSIPDNCGPYTFTPSAAFTDNGSPITSYSWTFTGGSPSSSTAQNPGSVTYNSPGTYTVQVSATNACGTTSTSTSFDVNPLPAAANIGDTAICIGESLSIGATAVSGSTYSWTSSPAGFTSSSANPTVSPTTTTTYYLTETITATGCQRSDTLTVTVNSLPTVNAGPDDTLCMDVPAFSLSGHSPSGGTWSGTGVSSGGTFTPSTAGAGSHTLTYSYTDVNGCTNTDTRTIRVNALPTVTTDPQDTFCNSSTTVTFSGSPSGGTWTGTGVTSGGVFTPSTAGNGTHDIYYVYTSPSTGCKDSALKEVTVISPSTVDAGSNDTVCVNNSAFSLTGYTPSSGGTWSGTGVSSGGTFTPSSAGVGSHTLTYSYGTGTCLVTDTKTVVVNDLPAVNAGADDTVCIDVPAFSLSGHSPSGGTWSGTGVSAGGVFTPSTAGSGTTTLTYSYTDTNGCTDTDTKSITVNALPTVTTDPQDTFCNSSTTVSFSGSPSGGSWTGSGVTSGGVFTPSSAGLGTHDLYYVYTDPSTGCSDSALKKVTVVNPSSINAGADDTVCISASAYSLTGFSPGGGTWSGTGVSSGGTFTPSSAGAGTHTLTYTFGTGTCLVSDTKTVIVNDLPTVNAGANDTVCIDVPAFSLTGHSPSGGTWSGTGVSAGGVFTPSTAGTGTQTLTYSYTDTNGCTDTDTRTITVNALPTVTTDPQDTFCNTSTTVTFSGSPGGGTWTGNGVTSGGVFTPSSAGNGTHDLYYIYTDPSTGCKDSALKEVTVVVPSSVDAGQNDTVCVDDTAFSLTGYSPSSGGAWSGTGVSSAGVFTPATAGSGTFTLTYSYGTGTCLVTDTKIVRVNPLPTVGAGADDTVCIDNPAFSMSGHSPSGGTWSGTGVSSGGTFTPSTAGAGTHTLTYSYTDPSTGCMNTDTKSITVNDLPTITTDPQDTFCNTSTTVTFTGSPSGGVWHGSGVTTGGVFTPSSAGVGSHDLYYVYTDGSTGCRDSALKEVEVVNPTSVDAGANDTLCVDDTAFTITGQSPASGGVWSGTGVSSSGVFTPATAGSGTFTLTYSYGVGTCLVSDTLVMVVNPLPTVDAGANDTVCIDNPAFSMSGHSPSGGTWSGTGISSGGTFTASTAGAGTHTLTYSYTDPSTGCINTDTVTITVNDLPTVTTDPQDTFCNTSTTVTFTGSPSGGVWRGSGVTTAGVFTPSSAGVGSHDLYYVYTDGSTGCRDSALKEVEVVNPTSVDAGANDTVCVDDTAFTITGQSPASGGVWSGTGVSSAGVFTPATAGSGTFTLTYSYGVGTCLVSDTLVMVVNPLPTVDAGANDTVCIDNPAFSMSGHSPTGGTWSGTGITSGGTFTASTAGAGTHTLTYSYTNPSTGCINTDTATITVNDLPTVTTDPQDTFCNTSTTVTFNGSPSGGVWHGSGVTTAGVFTPSSAGVGSHDLYYVYTDGSTGCRDSALKEVEVVNPTSVDAGANDTVCVDDTAFTITGQSPASGGVWSGTGVSSAGVFTPATAGSGTFTLTYSYGTGTCLVSDTLVMVVNPLPTADAGPSDTVCIDNPAFSMSGHSPSGGTWSGNGISSGGTFTASTAGAGTHTLTYSYTNPSTGCTNTDTTTITVNALPTVTTDPQDTFCNTSTTVTFSGSPSGGEWHGSGVTTTGVFTPSSAGVGSHDLYYVYTDGSTGCTDSALKEVEVVSPTTIDAGADDTVCVSDSDYSLTGYSPSSGGAWSGTGVTSAGVFSPSTGAGTYTLTYSYGTGTCLVTDTKTVIVNALPTVDAGPADTVCIDNPAFSMSGHSPSGGTWSGNGISSGGTFTASTAGSGTHTLTYSYTDPSTGCTNTDTTTIRVNALPTVTTDPQDTFCNTSTTVTFSGSPSGGVWHGSGVSTGGTFTPSSAGVGTHDLYYVYTDGSTGCTDSAHKEVVVVAPATIDAGSNDTVCVSDADFTLSGYTPASGGAWSGTGVTSSGTFSPSTGAGTYTLTYTYGTGTCLVTDTKIVRVNPLPTVDAGGPYTYCLNEPEATFSGHSPTGGIWSGNGITSSTLGRFSPALAGVGVHEIVYQYTDPTTSCVNRDTLEVEVFPLPVFTITNDSFQCKGVGASMQGNATGSYTYFWDFGDLTSGTGKSVSHAYANTGWYDIMLVATDSNGCRDTAYSKIRIAETPTSFFTLSPFSGPGPHTVSFTNQSTGEIDSFLWDFGNGDSSVLRDPPDITFQQSDSGDTVYHVKHIVTNRCGSSVWIDSVKVFPLPKARFGTDRNEGCSPLKVRFSNKSVGKPDTYFWDFGNGNTSTLKDPPPQTYTTDSLVKKYTITLIVTNNWGTDTATWEITVFPKNVEAFFNANPQKGCAPATIQFTDYSKGGTFIGWSFGDGDSSYQQHPTHTYTKPGIYKVRQFVNNDCSFDTAEFDITVHPAAIVKWTAMPACASDSIQFVNLSQNTAGGVWHFGDGDSSTLLHPKHKYANPGKYVVTLTGKSLTYGCIATFTDTAYAIELPVSNFTADPVEGCKPLEVQFTNTGTDSVFYTWTFGDGGSSVEEDPAHIYNDSGVYLITLRTINKLGCWSEHKDFVRVHPYPVSKFTIPSGPYCDTPQVIVFTNNSTGAVTYQWNFGNGQSSTDANGGAIFDTAGTYTVTLVSTNTFGCTDTSRQDFTIHAPPVADFSVIASACAMDSVQFINQSQGGVEYYWDLGDGTTSTEENPVHRYQASGQYTVRLRVKGVGGCEDSITKTNIININTKPVAGLTFTVQENPTTGWVDFSGSPVDGTWYQWDFGDGRLDSGENKHSLRHRYDQFGEYTVQLVVTNKFGCKDTITVSPNLVEYFDGLFVPNALSPESGPEGERIFLPQGASLKEYRLEIYNTWGERLWWTDKLVNGHPSEPFIGLNEDGEPLPQGVYVWKIQATFLNGQKWQGKDYNGKKQRLGTVTLIR